MLNIFYTYPYLIGLVAFMIGLILMPAIIKIAKKQNFVVRPNKRMSHTGEIPNIGGINICFSFMLTYMLFEFDQIQQSQFIMIGVFAIMIVGFIDDTLVLTPLTKLFGELIAGVALVGMADLRISHLHGIFGIEEISIVPSYLLSFFILVAIINAINLIDGVDGLASGLGMLYSLFFAIYFYMIGQTAWSILGICMIGSLAVFFCYNVFGHSHKIFMGDSGSLLLGYMMTTFIFHFCEVNVYEQLPPALHCNAAPAVAICVLSIPIFDTIRVSVTRIKNHKSPFQPDKNHIHHLLLRTGLTHVQTTCVLLSVSILCILLGWIGRNWNFWLLLLADMALCTALTVLLWRIIDRKEQHAKH